MKTATITLYTIDELSKDAKNKAIAEHKQFLLDTFRPDMYDESCKMTKTEYAMGLKREEVLENIEINEYLFYPNGELASVTKFVGGHERSGEEILTIKGIEYKITEAKTA